MNCLESITSLFRADHREIRKRIIDLEKNGITLIKIEQLKNALDRHFTNEEELYKKYVTLSGDRLPIIQTIMLEHIEMKSKIEDAHSKLGKGNKIDFSDLVLMLRRHENIEENLLYAELDKAFNDKKLFSYA